MNASLRQGAPSAAAVGNSERDAPEILKRTAVVIGLALIAGTYLVEALAVMRANRVWLVHRLPDDAYYYLEIGHRIAHGQGATFDGLNLTNGFHPLWQLLVAALAMVFSGDALVRATLLLALVCNVAAMYLLGRLMQKALGAGAAIFAVLVVVSAPSALANQVNGMEGAVTVLALALVTTALARVDARRRPVDAALLGAASGLAVLARLDLALVVWLIPAALIWRTRCWRLLAPWLGAASAVAGPFFLWNWWRFGHLLTVSGTVKLRELNHYVAERFGSRLTISYLHFLGSLLRSYWQVLEAGVSGGRFAGAAGPLGALAHHGLTLLAVAGLVVAVPRLRASLERGEHLAPLTFALLVASFVVALKGLADLVLLPFWAFSWYAEPQRIAIGLALGASAWVFLKRLSYAAPLPGTLAIVVVGLLLFPSNGRAVSDAPRAQLVSTNWQDASLQAATWIGAHGPAGRYGSPDAGLLGFYLDGARHVVNLDGLTNTYAYARALARGDSALQRYRTLGLDYLVARRLLDDPEVPPCAAVIWTSPSGVRYGGGLDTPTITSVPVHIWDLKPCGRS